jgi:hypothetical protein
MPRLTITSYWGDHNPGDTVTVDNSEARDLIGRGLATEDGTSPAEEPVGASAGTAKSKAKEAVK